MKAEIAWRGPARLGEGPTWDPAAGHLLWVDILAREVHAYGPSSGADRVLLRTGQHVGAAKPRAAGGHVVNLRDGIGAYDADGGFTWLADLRADGRRGNDAAVDPHGALWAGTMRYDEAPGGGSLYRLGPDHRLHTVLAGVTVSNGIAWSPDGHRMYYADTPTRRIDVFDLDDSGLPTDRHTFTSVTGLPDGLTVDTDGCVWTAIWEGGAVHRYTPDGGLDLVIDLPVPLTTACAFGGPNLHDLYITSADGPLFVVPDAGQGLPPTPFAG
ncbi:SMP-30/gluconolactonase/LRE family protein [Actinomadura spongiicola]|uniref:SMP-30/gluconolactonase/LRE family protein n=1 Tax=Actinomadura spongiicola TaxID=2303421 RepID=A0A372G979_9ACTN|nr:SMP-30/gluconolactonase/LRE family protein [Actinomadura spongiicola]RFS81958.1 SMP-30/gluconolactonase/LRE family protein [Actinomadura spongiicola]